MENEIEFVQASRDDLDTMIEWAAQEGWNPGLNDAECFWTADPKGFWTARRNGEMIACISLVRFSPIFAFLGFYIVRPDCRGQGVGYALWQHAAELFGRRRVVGLDAVPEQVYTYRKAGYFRTHRNVRYGGVPNLDAAASGNDDLVTVGTDHLEAINAYDEEFFPSTREVFLNNWLSAPGHVSKAAVTGGEVHGYGVIRPCREGHKVGPLFADDLETAERLFSSLVTESGAGQVYLDPPFANDDSLEMCARLGLEPVFETVRMYRGGMPPKLRFPGMFGITTFELG